MALAGALSPLRALPQEPAAPPLPGESLPQEPLPAPPLPWPDEIVAALRSFYERVDVEAVMESVPMPEISAGPRDPTGVVAALAPGLEAPFERVRAIRHATYAGSMLGARGALRAGHGNSIDQALLLAELYRARGLRSRLIRGRLGWRDAVQLVGPQPAELVDGDPWLRSVELVADHWWLEVRDGGRWMELDPTFPDGRPGSVRGTRREVHDELPARLQAVARVRLQHASGKVLGELELPAGQLVGSGVELSPCCAGGVAAGPPSEVPPPPGAAVEDPAAAAPESSAAEDMPDELDRYLQRARDQPAAIRIAAGGRRLDVPVEPGALELELQIVPVIGAALEMVIPVDPDRGDRVAIAVESGQAVAGALGLAAREIYDALGELHVSELATLAAYRERPTERPDFELDRIIEATAEPAPAGDERAEDEGDADEPMHPARDLHLAALRSWDRFHEVTPRAIALVTLAASEQLSPPMRTLRPPLRLVGVRWSPPGPAGGGRVTIWSADRVDVLSAEPGAARGAQIAYGFLRSALLGQLLHSVADAPPLTAFDLTLRSVGTGQRLVWLDGAAPLPGEWRGPVRDLAAADRRSGRTLVSSRAPLGGDEPAGGWWAVDPASGVTDGRIVRAGEVADAQVALGEPLQLADLGSVLASIPTLQDAARWLVTAGGPDREALRELLPGACAATALVTDLLGAGAPAGFPAPRFAAFCGGLAQR